MSSTAGLGQGTTVFDFSNIGKTGLMLDDRKEAKEQSFYERNKTLYDPMTTEGIRDVDAPYINEQLEKAMELSAKATQTKDPADIQAARNARAIVGSLTQESVTARKHAFETMAEVRKTQEYSRDSDRFERHLREQQAATAMTANNAGKVGEQIFYQAPIFYNLDKGLTDFVDEDSQTILRGSYESKGTATERADGTGSSASTAEVNVKERDRLIAENYAAQYDTNNDFRNAVQAQFMSEYFRTTDLSTEQVAQFNALVDLGDELPSQYKSVEEMEADPKLQRDPSTLRKYKRAWGIKEEIETRGQEMYSEAIKAKAVKGKQENTKSDFSKNSSGSGAKGVRYTKSSGVDAASVLGGNANIKSNAIEQSEGSVLGYTSTPDMKPRTTGSGTEKVLTGGVIAQRKSDGTFEYFAVEYKPSPDILSKIERGEDASGYLEKMDTMIVPLTSARARLFEDEIETLKANAEAEAEKLFEANKKAGSEGETTEDNTVRVPR